MEISSLMSTWETETSSVQGFVSAIFKGQQCFRLKVERADEVLLPAVQSAVEKSKDRTLFISLKTPYEQKLEPLDQVVFEGCSVFGDDAISATSVRRIAPWRQVVSCQSLMAREHVTPTSPCIVSTTSHVASPSGVHRRVEWWSDDDEETMFWTHKKTGNKERCLTMTITQRQWSTEEEATKCEPIRYRIRLWDHLLCPWIPKDDNWKALMLQHHIPFYALCNLEGHFVKTLAIQWDMRGYLEQSHDQLTISLEEAQARCACTNVVPMDEGDLVSISQTKTIPSGPGWQYYDLGHGCVLAMWTKSNDVTKRQKK